jgi:methylenetetrahydrofolate reductase (NADPH)
MRIADLFLSQSPVLSLEVFPPKREGDVDALYRVFDQIAPLKPAYVSVTYGAGGSNVGLHYDITVRLLKLGITPLPHFTCVGQGRQQITQTLDRLRDVGVENILALRGDPPQGQTKFVKHPDGFAYANELIEFIRERYSFCVGAAFYPEVHGEALNGAADLANLKRKVDAGAHFLNSQMVFDNAAYFAFTAKARAAGIRVPMVPGVMPVTSAKFFSRDFGVGFPAGFREGFGGNDAEADKAHGLSFAARQCQGFLRGGAPGVHLYIMNKAENALALWPSIHA